MPIWYRYFGQGNDILNLIVNSFKFHVGAYGAKGDGVTDDSAAIQAAIKAANANRGGTVYFDAKTYAIKSTITVPYSHIQLVGCGADSFHTGQIGNGSGSDRPNGCNNATELLWIGATSTTTPMVRIYSPAGKYLQVNSGMQGIGLDGGNKAGRGLQVESLRGGKFSNLLVCRVTNYGYYLTTAPGSDFGGVGPASFGQYDATDSQLNIWDRIGWFFPNPSSAIGWFMNGGNPTDGTGGDWSGNTFINLFGHTYNGEGMLLSYCDANAFWNANPFSNPGAAIRFHGGRPAGGTFGADGNMFYQCANSPPNPDAAPGSNIIEGTDSGWTNAPAFNQWVTWDQSGASAYPILGTGAMFTGPVAMGPNPQGQPSYQTTSKWTPTITAAVGAFGGITINAAKYRRMGKWLDFSLWFTVNAIGTAAGEWAVNPPRDWTAASQWVEPGCIFLGMNRTTGKALLGNFFSDTSIHFHQYDGGAPGTTGDDILLTGKYPQE